MKCYVSEPIRYNNLIRFLEILEDYKTRHTIDIPFVYSIDYENKKIVIDGHIGKILKGIIFEPLKCWSIKNNISII